MQSLCRECIDFFHFDIPKNSYSVYDCCKCEGCLQKTLTTNPKYYLSVHEKENTSPQQNCASTVEPAQEKIQ